MEIEIGTDPSLHLTKALLIYESDRHSRNGSSVVVTQHEVSKGKIQPGDPLDLAAFRKLLDNGVKQKEGGAWSWQFPRLLAESQSRILWWSPPGMKEVFIGDDGRKPKVREAWVPALIWCASRTSPHCYLWAYDGMTEPTKDTDIYRPQFGPTGTLNHVHHDCAICVGSMKVEGTTPEAWEKAFWSSRFKVAGNLNATKPYACKTRFQKIGTLQSSLPRSGAAD